MKIYTKKALKSGIFAGIGFGIATAGIDYYDGDDFQLWKFIFKVLFFAIFMGLYFNYSFKKQFEKESK
ncbi:hypothetical protein BTO06_01155 [Tenacibaculum sp. SZ-18]|uniref:hypothetical protein n=1 Tax=Tenacibaculum sp. SZ-18 TaxID=754423 RepID=UPI000C2D5037|nr:hypothetical protein [Tenacibaculum sp. SZ-18]AUC13842.1 hypothetical protein BTO06_01155 [Tenacibaculum sp. SZ-18]